MAEIPQVVAPISEFMLKFASVNPSAKRYLFRLVVRFTAILALVRSMKVSRAPISAYGLGKQMIEQAVQFVGRSYG